ncbi:MAG: phosphoribosylaminoimidazolesuccinocarboxamide synthase [Alphaproteobacteria bacterium]|jgi:phosphoribosylaminoimidazole-succinocarboxamide synthase|nr:phosphoribosylaminoimidazolesuccinocarboxamide synthase [Alphaproteobacteria bacterium]
MSEPFLSPTETARRLGVGVRALRLYERKGLVRPGRTTSGWRVYGAGDIERLHHVLTLKSLGLSLARIAQILGGRAPDLPALLALQEDVLTTRLHDLQRARKAVQAARATISRDGRLSLENLIDLVRETTMSTMDEARLAASAHQVLRDAIDPDLPGLYRGKVRDNYDLPDGRRILVTSDRLSAFDRVLCCVPFKGQVLNSVARWAFEQTADLCPNHVLDYPDPNIVVGRRLDILPVEIVVRGYLAGTTSTSILTMYRAGQREMYGHRLPDGLADNQALEAPMITPTSKAVDGAHDAPLTAEEIMGRGLLSEAQWRQVSETALALFARGQALAAERGLILADTKYEFGLDAEGTLRLADEIHTPDSSRYWRADTYSRRLAAGESPESFDKDVIRAWVAARCDPYAEDIPEIPPELIWKTALTYVEAHERITGRTFEPPKPAPAVQERVLAALEYFRRG